MNDIPRKFIDWAFHQRAELVRRQARGEDVPESEIFLGFTRHTPAIITYGPAGLNGSIKGIGFIPKKEFLEDNLEKYLGHIHSPVDDNYSHRGLGLLSKLVWAEGRESIIDFEKLGTLELAKAHTWENLLQNPHATLLFYEPPMISFEVRCDVEIHEEGVIHEFLNAQHDVYHHPNPSSWSKKPAYLFMIREIFDNSVGRNAFGKKIYP